MNIDNLVDDILLKNGESPLFIKDKTAWKDKTTWDLIQKIFKDLKRNSITNSLLYNIYKRAIDPNFGIVEVTTNPSKDYRFIKINDNGELSTYFWYSDNDIQPSIRKNVIKLLANNKMKKFKDVWVSYVIHYIERTYYAFKFLDKYVCDIQNNTNSKMDLTIFRVFCAAFYESLKNMKKYKEFKDINADNYIEETWVAKDEKPIEYLSTFSPLHGITQKIHDGVHISRRSICLNMEI